MKIALITDAWLPQVNGVVTTLVELVREVQLLGHEVVVIHPGLFRTRPCPGYDGIDLAIRPARRLREMLHELAPDAIHLATEGPLGWAARAHCLKHGLAFTTAFHTKFPEILKAALKVPLGLGYGVFRHFHKPSSGVLVPTQGVLRMLEKRGFRNLRSWTHGVDTSLFSFHEQVTVNPAIGILARPVSMFVGRVSYEKNIEVFLQLDVPGTKVVCGVGPLEATLKARYPQVRWLGVLPRDELARIYAAADVFVLPSKSETFGLVMLEAMACGTPVAAYPVDGPMEVLGQSTGQVRGGVLHDDLKSAWYQALAVSRHEARMRSLDFSWQRASELFLSHLVAAPKSGRMDQVASLGMAVTRMSSKP
ncbi:MAG: glycosyltransferase family 1 protein [Gammaproteobacteria bacterium]|nr:glycosyltransferase family 1 protein [Gammaproteobacteria bacterium]MBU0786093.1 glycosyltransferase family 1 protein [Gammaproteobacteria bacterium]MBU0816673.1 glycosyltransferase family 1 protein [Gammaproteobacteria bacterium]MBU1786837.1 glycosyltransferase family 1 protein [Gammaproteobacteria bacterium]